MKILAKVKSNDDLWLVVIIAIDKDAFEALCVDAEGKFLVLPLGSLTVVDGEILDHFWRWTGS